MSSSPCACKDKMPCRQAGKSQGQTLAASHPSNSILILSYHLTDTTQNGTSVAFGCEDPDFPTVQNGMALRYNMSQSTCISTRKERKKAPLPEAVRITTPLRRKLSANDAETERASELSLATTTSRSLHGDDVHSVILDFAPGSAGGFMIRSGRLLSQGYEPIVGLRESQLIGASHLAPRIVVSLWSDLVFER